MNVIDSNKMEHDVVRKPLRTFRHHALIGGVIAGVAVAILPAAAQRLMPDNGNGRYSLVPKGDGFMRLDSRTGEISICAWRGAGWECVGVPDDRAAYDAEIGRLRDMIERLKRELAARDRLPKESPGSATIGPKDTSRPPSVDAAPPAKAIDMPAPVAAEMMRASREMVQEIERLKTELGAREAERRAADAAEIARLKQESDRLRQELAERDRAIGEAKTAAEAAEKKELRPPASLPPPIAERKSAQAEKELPSSGREPPAMKNLEPRLPDDAELDRAIAYLERAWRKLIDMVQRLQRESDRRI